MVVCTYSSGSTIPDTMPCVDPYLNASINTSGTIKTNIISYEDYLEFSIYEMVLIIFIGFLGVVLSFFWKK